MVLHSFRPLRLVARSEWTGALGPDLPALEESPPDPATLGPPFQPIQRPVHFVIYTKETPSPRCYTYDECLKAVRKLYHLFVVQMGMPDLPFNFLVGEDGTVFEARGWRAQPSLQIPYFPQHHGDRMDIALIGDYSVEPMPWHMVDACADIVGVGLDLGIVNGVYDTLQALDLTRLKQLAQDEKKKSPWENWQVQKMAKKIFKEELPYEESAQKMKELILDGKMKGIMRRENLPTNTWCVIM